MAIDDRQEGARPEDDPVRLGDRVMTPFHAEFAEWLAAERNIPRADAEFQARSLALFTGILGVQGVRVPLVTIDRSHLAQLRGWLQARDASPELVRSAWPVLQSWVTWLLRVDRWEGTVAEADQVTRLLEGLARPEEAMTRRSLRDLAEGVPREALDRWAADSYLAHLVGAVLSRTVAGALVEDGHLAAAEVARVAELLGAPVERSVLDTTWERLSARGTVIVDGGVARPGPAVDGWHRPGPTRLRTCQEVAVGILAGLQQEVLDEFGPMAPVAALLPVVPRLIAIGVLAVDRAGLDREVDDLLANFGDGSGAFGEGREQQTRAARRLLDEIRTIGLLQLGPNGFAVDPGWLAPLAAFADGMAGQRS